MWVAFISQTDERLWDDFQHKHTKLSLMSSRSQETKPLMAPPAPRPEELMKNSWIISSEWQLKHLKPVEFSCFLNDLKELFQARGSRREITTSVIPSERERERESSHHLLMLVKGKMNSLSVYTALERSVCWKQPASERKSTLRLYGKLQKPECEASEQESSWSLQDLVKVS